MNAWLIIAVFAAGLAVFVMVDILRVKMTYNKKMIWFAIVVLIPLVGPLLYLLRKRNLIAP